MTIAFAADIDGRLTSLCVYLKGALTSALGIHSRTAEGHPASRRETEACDALIGKLNELGGEAQLNFTRVRANLVSLEGELMIQALGSLQVHNRSLLETTDTKNRQRYERFVTADVLLARAL
jgi:hypothetical protein